MVRLSQLKRHQQATITAVTSAVMPATATPLQDSTSTTQADPIGQRLQTLGFIPGEQVTVLALGLFGRDPVLVQIGFTRFALRRTEADRIQVEIRA
jgi:ferrous iron transport protein A